VAHAEAFVFASPAGVARARPAPFFSRQFDAELLNSCVRGIAYADERTPQISDLEDDADAYAADLHRLATTMSAYDAYVWDRRYEGDGFREARRDRIAFMSALNAFSATIVRCVRHCACTRVRCGRSNSPRSFAAKVEF
jgi:hypothetical protein